MLIDYYALLALPRTATIEEIKHAYRRMASIHHPDKSAFQGDEAESAEVMTQLNEAMTVFNDPPAKQKYDYDLSFIPERKDRARPAPAAAPAATPAATPRASAPPPVPSPRAAAPPPATPRAAAAPPATPSAPAARVSTPPRVATPPPATPRITPPPAPAARASTPPPPTLRARLLTLPLTWKDLKWNGWTLSLQATRAGSEPLVLVERHFETLAPATVQIVDDAISTSLDRHPDFLRAKTIVLLTCRRVAERELVIKELEQAAKKSRGWFKTKPMLAVFDEQRKSGIRAGQAPEQSFAESILGIMLSA